MPNDIDNWIVINYVRAMKYELGQQLVWISDYRWEPYSWVTVTALRSRGQARLSNGWTVDEEGVAEGSNRQLGGRVFIGLDVAREMGAIVYDEAVA